MFDKIVAMSLRTFDPAVQCPAVEHVLDDTDPAVADNEQKRRDDNACANGCQKTDPINNDQHDRRLRNGESNLKAVSKVLMD